ncbi:MAG: chromosome segregation protein SMC [Planctomycetaceae bacterium]|nr:chromosome segregation protein SMC [Planctomycetaceae bacterium]
MLKVLELAGFKSFADRTRFEFSKGITCVVGPNGSGKSNVVDAIKWVLGEQSVKSLRGKEMADVIFNGSATRSPMGAAEVTLSFDNSSEKLPVEGPEVAITRRVYRNGDSEYLINKQPCRLRDIRDLFSGTGAATDAYSVIEQGKVDAMLQSSPKERRAVFEEAAGISRFKARKLESLRRLERVDQNMLRLHDIVEEVENRLKSVRNQATKARRYQEYVERLQQLRTQTAQVDWRKLSEKLVEQETALAERSSRREELALALDAAEARLLEIDVKLGDVVAELRRAEAAVSESRQRISADESQIHHERQRVRELEEEAARQRRHFVDLTSKAGDERIAFVELSAAADAAHTRHLELVEGRAALENRRTSLEAERRELETQLDFRRRRIRELLQLGASAESEAATLDARLAAQVDERTRREKRLAELAGREQSLAEETAEHRALLAAIEARLAEATAACQGAREEIATLQDASTGAVEHVNELRRRQAALAERSHLLEDLERRQDGLQVGVKQILGLRAKNEAGLLQESAGLAADLIRSPFDIAPAVDAALGDRAQFIVAPKSSDPAEIADYATTQLQGRVGFLFLDGLPAAERETGDTSPAGKPGVVGRLDLLVDCDYEFRGIVRTLLGTTWLVDTLARAFELRREFPQLDFVTRSGDLVTYDGEMLVGRRAAGVGLVSRRSELQALREQILQVDEDITAAAGQVKVAERRVEQRATELRLLETAERARLQEALDERSRGKGLEQQHEQLRSQLEAMQREVDSAAAETAEVERRRNEAETRRHAAQVDADAAEREVAELEARREQTAAGRLELEEQLTAARVDLAKSEERLNNLRAQKIRQEQDQVERARAIADSRKQLAESLARKRISEFNILAAEQSAAYAYLRKESLARDAAALVARQESLRVERSGLAGSAQAERNRMRTLQEELHTLELSVETTRIERTNLADRIRDDYGIELAALEAPPADEGERQQREETEQQIADLRRKINNIGNVNLEALEEIDELETRYTTLSTQFNDLTDAKKSLEQIIARIDADSRRLFQETLETVRANFQILFRKLFGGGQGDVLLEEGVDILDAGIEITARPPGKETRNISLLSGGEKTLTCVALLLAVFQYRPSPFCVLDEVDAALDEANIGRFVGVLHEFLTWTQFIIVTHSKKTMTCASTLYGVTMQESGISKRVAVRFEDVTDDGHIITRRDVDAEGDKADTDAA